MAIIALTFVSFAINLGIKVIRAVPAATRRPSHRPGMGGRARLLWHCRPRLPSSAAAT